MDFFEIMLQQKLAGGGGDEPVIEALSVIENGTYTAPSGVDGYSPITVNVSGGGGEGLTLLASEEVMVETASTTAAVVKEIPINESDYLGTKLLLVLIYDKAGFSTGHFYSTINLIQYPTIQDKPIVNYGVYLNTSNRYPGWASTNGVYVSSVTRSSGVSTLKISAKQNSSSGTVTGSTYAIKVYAVAVPSNFVFPS